MARNTGGPTRVYPKGYEVARLRREIKRLHARIAVLNALYLFMFAVSMTVSVIALGVATRG